MSAEDVGDGTYRLPDTAAPEASRCNGRTVIRESRDHEDPERRGQPILDEDGARQYRPCIAYRANGTEYCVTHGGNAPQTINNAKRTLALAAERVAKGMVAIAVDERLPAETRLKAQAQLLDRVGVRTGVDISLETPGWQKMLGELFGAEPGAPGALTSEEQADVAEALEATAKPVAKAARPRKAAAPTPPIAPTPPVEEAKPKRAPARKAPAKKAAPTKAARPKFEGWG